ncbi:MAG: hypothetical protein E3J26_04760, partial [Candidatus Zixiibacteriota bacterium]
MNFREELIEDLVLTDPASTVLLIGYLRGDIAAAGGESASEKEYVNSCIRRAPQLKKMIKGNCRLSFAQFNELLLLIDKNRIGKGFFYYFFVPTESWFDLPADRIEKPLQIAEQLQESLYDGRPLASYNISKTEFRTGVIRFRGFAMLRYGNFRFAHKDLRNKTIAEICDVLQPFSSDKHIMENKYQLRPAKALAFQPIDGNDTWLPGYLSAPSLDDASYLLHAALSYLRPAEYQQILRKRKPTKEKQSKLDAKISMLTAEAAKHWRPHIDGFLE